MSMMLGSLVIIRMLANGPDASGPLAGRQEKPDVQTTASSEATRGFRVTMQW